MNYETLIERDLDAIPAAAQAFLATHGAEALWVSVTRFAVLAFAPSQHAKRAVLACRAAFAVREELGVRWPDLIVACAQYAAASRQPWSEPPILEPPEPGVGDLAELRAAMAEGDLVRAERWLSARLSDAAGPLREVARGDAVLLLEAALALLPALGEKGRYALLRMPLWELVASPSVAEDVTDLESLLVRAEVGKGSPDAVQPLLVALAKQEGARSSGTFRQLDPYPLARDYAQTLLAHAFADRLMPEQAKRLLDVVHQNLAEGENFAAWSFA
ncbi:MAG: hypothetical protein ABI779_07945 [Acidobacteriota bacterium]